MSGTHGPMVGSLKCIVGEILWLTYVSFAFLCDPRIQLPLQQLCRNHQTVEFLAVIAVPVGWSGLLMLMYTQGHPRSQKEKQRQLKWLRRQYRTLWLLDIRLAAWLIAKWAAICPVGSQNHMASDVMPVGLVTWGVVRQQPSWWSSPCECGIWMVPGSKKLWSFVANSTCPFSICIRIVPSPLGCFLKWGQDHWLSVSNFRMTNHCDIDVQDAWSMMICMFGGYHCCVVFFGNGNSCHWIHWTILDL